MKTCSRQLPSRSSRRSPAPAMAVLRRLFPVRRKQLLAGAQQGSAAACRRRPGAARATGRRARRLGSCPRQPERDHNQVHCRWLWTKPVTDAYCRVFCGHVSLSAIVGGDATAANAVASVRRRGRRRAFGDCSPRRGAGRTVAGGAGAVRPAAQIRAVPALQATAPGRARGAWTPRVPGRDGAAAAGGRGRCRKRAVLVYGRSHGNGAGGGAGSAPC